MGNLGPASNHSEASRIPPRSRASERMIAEDSRSEPIAALAIVLAISIAAYSTACAGRSVTEVPVRNSASSRAMVISGSFWEYRSRRGYRIAALQAFPGGAIAARWVLGEERPPCL